MTTLVDSLAVEIGLDPKKLIEGLKDIEQRVKQRKDDFQKESSVWEQSILNLTRLIGQLTVAFFSIEAAISAFKASEAIARQGTAMSNFAEAVGMTNQQLSQWEQAFERVGGKAEEAGEAFRFQRTELGKIKGPEGQAPAFKAWMDRMGMDPNAYFNARGPDVQKLELDLFEKLKGTDEEIFAKYKGTRQQILEAFGFKGTSAQELSRRDVRSELTRAGRTAPTEENIATFKRLNALWVDLHNNMAAVKNDLFTFFETPLRTVLDLINQVLEHIHKFSWHKEGKEIADEIEKEGFLTATFWPHLYDKEGHGHAATLQELKDYFAGKRPDLYPTPGAAKAKNAPPDYINKVPGTIDPLTGKQIAPDESSILHSMIGAVRNVLTPPPKSPESVLRTSPTTSTSVPPSTAPSSSEPSSREENIQSHDKSYQDLIEGIKSTFSKPPYAPPSAPPQAEQLPGGAAMVGPRTGVHRPSWMPRETAAPATSVPSVPLSQPTPPAAAQQAPLQLITPAQAASSSPEPRAVPEAPTAPMRRLTAPAPAPIIVQPAKPTQAAPQPAPVTSWPLPATPPASTSPPPANVPTSEPPASFEQRWPHYDQHSSLQPMQMPQLANMSTLGAFATAGKSTVTTNSTVSIGAMTFNSSGNAGQTVGIGVAPAPLGKELEGGAYAMMSNTSLE